MREHRRCHRGRSGSCSCIADTRPEWRGAKSVNMQTRAPMPRPLQADGSVHSSRLAPHYIFDIRIRRTNLLDRFSKTRKLRGGIALSKQFLNNRGVRFRKIDASAQLSRLTE